MSSGSPATAEHPEHTERTDEPDHVDRVIAEWAAVRPDLDLSPVQVVLRLERLAVHLERAVDEVFDVAGVHRSGFAVLANLRRIGPPHRLTPTQLRRNLLSSWGATVNRLDRLEAAKLVRRLPDPDDRRGTIIELTPDGIELTDRIVEDHLANEAALLAPLRDEQRDQLIAALRVLLARWEGPSSGEGPAASPVQRKASA